MAYIIKDDKRSLKFLKIIKKQGGVKVQTNQLFWNKEKDDFIIENYGKIPSKEIAFQLKTTNNKVRCRAFYLRKKGQPVFKHSFINWRDPEIKERLMTVYGGKPTHQAAKELGITVSALYAATRRLKIGFNGNDGRYTLPELAKLLKIDPKTIKKWIKLGLKISYAKDGLTYSLSRKLKIVKKPKYFCALIDLTDIKKFFKVRPEAYNLTELDSETRHLLEVNNLKILWQEKRVSCKKCNLNFWTTLYVQYQKCPKCGRFISEWAINYR